MSLVVCGCLVDESRAADPEPLDVEFLDYLANCEGKDHNWTVVANDKERKKAASPPSANPPAAVTEPPKSKEGAQ